MKKILIVDDDNAILECLQYILDDAGYEPCLLNDTEHFYDTVQSWQPDLVILDMLLRGTNGVQLCQRLKESPATKHIPVLLFSASNKVAESAKKAHADGYIAKPFNLDDFLKLVETHT